MCWSRKMKLDEVGMARPFNFLFCTDSASPHVCDTVLFESQNFVVVPTIGSIVPGWLLVVTKSPYLRMSALDEDKLSELITVRDRAVTALRDSFHSPVVTFEHGPFSRGENVGCGVDHAHLHVVAIESSLLDSAKKLDCAELPWQQVTNLQEGLTNCRSSYLIIEDVDGHCYRTDATDAPSQYFRRAIAAMIGVPSQYDWKRFPFVENVTQTIQRCKAKFRQSGTLALHHEYRNT